jgi:hypothetical protein
MSHRPFPGMLKVSDLLRVSDGKDGYMKTQGRLSAREYLSSGSPGAGDHRVTSWTENESGLHGARISEIKGRGSMGRPEKISLFTPSLLNQGLD